MLFLYSSMCTSAFEHWAMASASAAMVAFWMFSGVLFLMKKDISVWPSSDLPEPFGPKRFRMGKFLVYDVTMSRNSVAKRYMTPTLALSPKTSDIISQ